jgi:uncharacterized membrane protein YfcA
MTTPLDAILTFSMGIVSGLMGGMLGLGGGVFLVPFLILGLGLKFQAAAAISLFAVIATSSAVTAARAGRDLINLRLGMVLEVATAAGGLTGGLTAQMLSSATLQVMFSIIAGAIAIAVMRRPHDEILPQPADPGLLGGVYRDERTGRSFTYRVQRLPLGLVASFLAGNISSLLGVGGGIVKVPVMVTWCGVPMRVAAATSALMIGVTAVSGAAIYLGRGGLMYQLAAAAILGTQIGSAAGLRLSARTHTTRLKGLLSIVLMTVSLLMLGRSL